MQVLLNSMLQERQAQQRLPQHEAMQNGHAEPNEDDRPKPCVPQAEQIRPAAAAAASGSIDVVNGPPSQQAPGDSAERDEDSVSAISRSEKLFKMEWVFTKHAKYPVMRLRQAGKVT